MEQLQPCEVGPDVQETQHREDVMILPCTLKPNSEGRLIPHVALHRHQNGAYHPIGGKVGDQDGHHEETLPMALQRELLEEATDDEDTTRKLTRWAALAEPSVVWYRAPNEDLVKGRVWSVVTDLPLLLRNKEPHNHAETAYFPVEQVLADEQMWARPSLYQVVKHKIQRALAARQQEQSKVA